MDLADTIREQLENLQRLTDQLRAETGINTEANDRLIEETKELVDKIPVLPSLQASRFVSENNL